MRRASVPSDLYPYARRSPMRWRRHFQSVAAIDFYCGVERPIEVEMVRNQERVTKRTIRRHQLREMVPLADSTVYQMEQRGEFPRRFMLSPRCVVWDLGEVETWLESRRTKPIVPAKGPDVRQRRTRPVKAQDRVLTKA